MLGFWSIGPGELAAILIIAVLVFGRRLPEVARAVGKAIGELKSGLDQVGSSVGDQLPEDFKDE